MWFLHCVYRIGVRFVGIQRKAHSQFYAPRGSCGAVDSGDRVRHAACNENRMRHANPCPLWQTSRQPPVMRLARERKPHAVRLTRRLLLLRGARVVRRERGETLRGRRGEDCGGRK